jgi:hypothetical protein
VKKLLWLISTLFLTACIQMLPAVKVAEESMVQDCEFVATISETTDPGRMLDNYRPSEHQDEVLQRAANLGATHIVWVFNYRVGSSANAYRCSR